MKNATTVLIIGLTLVGVFVRLAFAQDKSAEGQAAKAGLFPVAVDNKWGYIDNTGAMMISPQFESADFFYGGFAAVQVTGQGSDTVGKYGFIDPAGKMVVPAQYDYYRVFYEGRAAVRVGGEGPDGRGKWGFVDTTGRVIVEPQFIDALYYLEGLAPVLVGSEQPLQGARWGYIDTSGKLVIAPQFIEAFCFSTEGLARVKVRLGDRVKEDKWGFVDKTGKMAIEPKFDDALGFTEGLAAVKVGDGDTGKWGYIDKTGKMVIEPQFDSAQSFGEGLAAVEFLQPSVRGDDWGYIDHAGKFAILPQFNNPSGFSEGLAAVETGNSLYGYIDKTGKVVIAAKYGWCGDFSNGVAAVNVGGIGYYLYGGENGYIDKTGKPIWGLENASNLPQSPLTRPFSIYPHSIYPRQRQGATAPPATLPNGMGGEEMMNNLQQAISTQQAEVIAVPLTKEELGIPKGVYQEFGNMGRTSSVPFLPPKEKPHVLWSDSFENWWPDARIAVDDDGYTWLAAEKKLGEFPHICRIDPNGNIQWSVAVTLPDDMILRVLSGAFPFNVSYPVVTCNGAVIFLTTIFESPAKQAFEAYDKTGRLRWRSKWEDMSIQGAWRVSSDRLVALNEGLDHNQLEFYSLADGSLVETAEDHIEANAIAEAGGPHEMPDGSWISLVSHNFVQRYTLPDRKLVWNLLPDPENRIRPVAPMFDDDYVIVGARHSLICADADSGNKVWEIPNEYGFDPMAVTPQGNILTIGYFEHRGRLLLVSKDGSVLWQTSNANSGPGSPKYSLWPSSHVIYGDGSILLGGTNSLQLLRPDGTVAWELSGQDLGAGDKKLEMWRLFPTSDGRIIGANTPGFMGPEGNLICLGSGDDQGGNAQ